MTEKLAVHFLAQAVKIGVKDFCLCPGARNYLLADLLLNENKITTYTGMDERSAAFFMLGKSKKEKRPAAVITTSGTAVGELLPAAMEAYYSGVPLLLITGDRPKTYRTTNAPQAADQLNILGQFAPFQLDLENEDMEFNLENWNQIYPAHVNICFEEPKDAPSTCYINFDEVKEPFVNYSHDFWNIRKENVLVGESGHRALDQFLEKVQCPFVIVNSLKEKYHEAVIQFLLKLNAPVLLESISGLRENPRLEHLRITRTYHTFTHASACGHDIDGVLRIGGVPTTRLWRDLEDRKDVSVFSINDTPFTGISWGTMAFAPIDQFLNTYSLKKQYKTAAQWIFADKHFEQQTRLLMHRLPSSEANLVYELSKALPQRSQIFLGNSLPIREWDLGATYENKHFLTFANRGLNGIDGEISTYLGMMDNVRENWCILGDLTTLYDMNGFWFLSQLKYGKVRFVVINNHGGRIFAHKFSNTAFQNEHNISFEHLAKFWA